MKQQKQLYAARFNPLLVRPVRPLPEAVAVIGAGTIGPDIAYYLNRLEIQKHPCGENEHQSPEAETDNDQYCGLFPHPL